MEQARAAGRRVANIPEVRLRGRASVATEAQRPFVEPSMLSSLAAWFRTHLTDGVMTLNHFHQWCPVSFGRRLTDTLAFVRKYPSMFELRWDIGTRSFLMSEPAPGTTCSTTVIGATAMQEAASNSPRQSDTFSSSRSSNAKPPDG